MFDFYALFYYTKNTYLKLGEKMENIDLTFKRKPLKTGEVPTIEEVEKDLVPKVMELLSPKFKANTELTRWFKTFLSISAYSGWATELRINKKGNNPMVVSGASEPMGEIFQAVVTDDGFSIATSPIKNIEELHIENDGLLAMLDITPNKKDRDDDYDETVQYSIAKRGEYTITMLEEVPHILKNFPEANQFPTDGKVGSYLKAYYKEYLKNYPASKNPVSTRASYSYTSRANDSNPQEIKSNFDIITLDGLFVIKVNGQEYMRTRELADVKEAIANHPDISGDLNKNMVAMEYLDKFILSYENRTKHTFIINGMLK